MARYTGNTEPRDRATAITAVAALHMVLAAYLIGAPRIVPEPDNDAPMTLIDIAEPPPPPPPPEPGQASKEQGEAGKNADPTPVVAPAPRFTVPSPLIIAAAPIAGSGTSASAGAAAAGSGSGAGGQSSGLGAVGNGGGIGREARLLSGGLTRRDYRSLRAHSIPAGRAVLAIMVGSDGRVTNCTAAYSSGDPALDAAICAILQPRMRFAPALDSAGQPIPVRAHYVAIWDRG